MLKLIRHLLPKSPLWSLTKSRPFSGLFSAMGEVVAEGRETIDRAYLESIPRYTSDPIEQLTRRGVSLSYIAHLSEARARRLLEALDLASEGMQPARLQWLLQEAGFPVYVHEWFSSGPPWVERDPTEHMQRPRIGNTRCGMARARCGVPDARCDSFLINEVNYLVNQSLLPFPPPWISPSGYRGVFYIGAETFPDIAILSPDDRRLLEFLVLRYKRASQWVVMLVDYFDPLHIFNVTTPGQTIIDGEYQSVPDAGSAGGNWVAPLADRRPNVRRMYNLIDGILVERDAPFHTGSDQFGSSLANAIWSFLINPGGSTELMWWMCVPAPTTSNRVIVYNANAAQPQVGIRLEHLTASSGQFRLRWSNGTTEEVTEGLSAGSTPLLGQYFYRLARTSTTYRLYRDEALLLTCEQPNLNDLAPTVQMRLGGTGAAGASIEGYIPQFLADSRRASANMIATVRAQMEQWRDVTAMACFRFDFDKGLVSGEGRLYTQHDTGFRNYGNDYLDGAGDGPRATIIEETGWQIAQFNGAERMIYSGAASLFNLLHLSTGACEVRVRLWLGDSSKPHTILCNADAVGSSDVGIDFEVRIGGSTRLRLRNSGGFMQVSSAGFVFDEWNTLTIRRNGASITIQVNDNTPVAETVPTATSGDPSSEMRVGSRPTPDVSTMTGYIAFITIHDYELDAAEDEWMDDMMGAIDGTPRQQIVAMSGMDAWFDADDSNLDLLSINHDVDLRGTVTNISVTRANEAGPDSELGISVTESNGTNATHLLRYPTPANIERGPVKISTRLRTYDGAISSNATRWIMPWFSFTSGNQYIPGEDDFLDPDYTFVRKFTLAERTDGFDLAPVSGDWFDIDVHTHISSNATGIVGPEIRTNGSVVGNNSRVVDIASINVSQDRVIAVDDVRETGELFNMATNSQRMCLVDNWLGGACFVETRTDGTTTTRFENAAITPSVVGITAAVGNNVLTSNERVLQVGDIVLACNAKTWRLIQGATSVDTGYPVGTVPVAIILRITGGAADLFIDGMQRGTAAFTQGGTGVVVAGSRAELSVKNGCWENATMSDIEIASVAEDMRTRAELPAIWPAIGWTGQSNATHAINATARVLANGLRQTPLHAQYFADYAVTPVPAEERWLPGPWMHYGTAGLSGRFGASYGFLKAAQDAGRPCVVICSARGGAPATQWGPGGDMRTRLSAVITAALAEFGTHLVELDSVVWIQGENEATNGVGTYLSDVRALRTWIRDTWGAQVKFIGLTLHADVTLTYDKDVRAIQAILQAEDPLTKYVQINAELGDPVHYTASGMLDVGAGIFETWDTFDTAFDPASISGGIAGFMVGRGMTLVSGAVEEMTDQAGLGNTITAPTAGGRAVLEPNWRNGMPALIGRSDSVAVGLTRATHAQGARSQPFTRYAVAEWTGSTNKYLFHGRTTRADLFAAVTTNYPTSFAGTVLAAASAPTSGTPCIIRQVFNGDGSSTIRVEPHGAAPITVTGNAGSDNLNGIAWLFFHGSAGNNWMGDAAFLWDFAGNLPASAPADDEYIMQGLRDTYNIVHT